MFVADLDAHQVAPDGTAVALAAAARSSDVVGRLGGSAPARPRRRPAARCLRGGSSPARSAFGAAARPPPRPRPPFLAAGARAARRRRGRAAAGARGRAGVADLRLAHEGPLGRLDRRPVLAHRLGHLRAVVAARRRRRRRAAVGLAAALAAARAAPALAGRRCASPSASPRRVGVGAVAPPSGRRSSAPRASGSQRRVGAGRASGPAISLSMFVLSHAPTRGAGTTAGSASTSRRSPSCSIH